VLAAVAVLLAVASALAGARTLRPLPPLPAVSTGPRIPVAHPPGRRSERVGGLDATFLAFSDTHFGYGSSERDLFGARKDALRSPTGTQQVNARAIEAMNEIPGRPWPEQLGGVIGKPRGLLISGDLTEDGQAWQWHDFARYYGLDGRDGLVRYPVFEGHGNHDKQGDYVVLKRIRQRHGGTVYAFDWDDLHVVCLGEAPDRAELAWLARDLAEIGQQRPVLIYFHFPLQGPYAEDNWFGRGDYRDRFAETITGYNVIAVVHGHYHASGRYRWRSWDVYNVGAAKHRQHSFAVVHVSDRRLRVASYQFDERRWEWWHDKPINGDAGSSVSSGEHAYSNRSR
jgi:hypothetical protein